MNFPSPLARPQDVMVALALLTRLPVRLNNWDRQAEAAWAYALVGIVVGGGSALVALSALACGLPTAIGTLLAVFTQIMMTGAMHEDGLADTADGFWGGWTPARRLEIMKDSQIGSYGVISLILSIGLRWAALWALWDIGAAIAIPAMLSAAILSRSTMPVLMATLPHARQDGLSHQVGRVPGGTALLGGGIAMLLDLALLGSGVFWPVIWLTVLVIGIASMTQTKIGGQTGDVLGAAQQLAEITILLVLLT